MSDSEMTLMLKVPPLRKWLALLVCGKWDGHTVDLDSRGQIARKFTDAALVSVPARVAILRHVIEKGGTIVANGHPGARELRSIPYIRSAETRWELVPDFHAVKKLLAPAKPAA